MKKKNNNNNSNNNFCLAFAATPLNLFVWFRAT